MDNERVISSSENRSPRDNFERWVDGKFTLAELGSMSARTLESTEVYDYKAELIESADTLAKNLGVEPAFFDDEGDALLYLAAADGHLSNEKAKGSEGYTERRAFYEDYILKLTQKHNSVIRDSGEPKYERYKEVPEDQEKAKKVYEKLKNTELTDKLNKERDNFSADGIFGAVREKLGIRSKDDEQEFEFLVIDAGSESHFYGLNPGALAFKSRQEFPSEEEFEAYQLEFDARMRESDEHRAWEKHLATNNEELLEAIDAKAFVAHVTQIDGKNNLVLSSAAVIKILEGGASKTFTRADKERETAMLMHEYTHTQKDVGFSLGLMLEERRAELFSGDRHGYPEAKQFFINLGIITGVDVPKLLEDAYQTPNPKAELMTSLIKNLGFKNTLLITALRPLPYADQKNIGVASMPELGETASDEDHGINYNRFLEMVYAEQVDKDGGPEEVEKRIDARAKLLIERLSPDAFEWIFNNQRQSARQQFITDKLEQRVAELRAA